MAAVPRDYIGYGIEERFEAGAFLGQRFVDEFTKSGGSCRDQNGTVGQGFVIVGDSLQGSSAQGADLVGIIGRHSKIIYTFQGFCQFLLIERK